MQVFCFPREWVNKILSSDLHKAIKSVDLIKEIQLFLKDYCGLDTTPPKSCEHDHWMMMNAFVINKKNKTIDVMSEKKFPSYSYVTVVFMMINNED